QLTFSSLSYESQDVTIGNRKTISVVLAEAGATEMTGVVVTGITRVKKSQYTGAANKIVAKEIESKPVGSLDQLLQGRSPGLLSLTGSGQPGNSATTIIRGQNSVAGGTDPLYIMDGIPIEVGVFQSINPNDIASIDILRDAATLSLYGSRGSGGVIVITSKRGQAGKVKISYSGQMGVKSRPDFAFTPMTTTELLKAQHDYGKVLIDDAGVNNNSAIPGWYYSSDNPRYQALSPAGQALADAALDSISKINTNWYDEFFRQGTFSNHEISLSGGTGKTRFFSSMGLYNEQGIINPSDMKRMTLRNNVDFADDKFSFQISTLVGYTKRNFDPAFPGFIFNSFLTPAIATPYSQARNANGGYYTGGTASDFNYFAANYLDLKTWDKSYNDQIKVNAGINIGYKIAKYLTAGLTAGVDFRETQSSYYESRAAYLRQPGVTTSPTQLAGSMSEGLTRFVNAVVRPSLTFNNKFKNQHDVEVSLFGEYVQEDNKAIYFKGYGIDPRTPNTIGALPTSNSNLATQIIAPRANNGLTHSALASGLLMGRYTYKDKYTISGSYRRDGSSKLPEDNRWTGFYSVGAVWNIANENFMNNVKFVNSLRLRASYGGVGNHDNFPSSYLYLPTYGTGSYAGLPTQIATYPGNKDAKWETTYTLNFGLDFELLNRRLYGDVNWYDRRTKDLFLEKQLAAEGGTFAIYLNTGELQNTGFEWNLNFDVIRNRNMVWTLFTTGAYNKNTLLSLGGVEPYEDGTSFIQEGLPLGTHYEVTWAGVDASTGQPLYYDLNGNITNIYTASNATTNHGTWEAPWKGGFGTSLTFKGFDFNALFTWQEGAYKVDNLEYFVENFGFMSQGFNQSNSLNFWQNPGDVTSTPSPKYPINFSSKIIHDASFLRLKDVVIGYTVPSNLLKNSKVISKARFYIQGSNLFMWTKWRGLDPEAGAVNLNLSEFPNPRAFTAGINLTF
ncbi:MAG: SusC/RagA family TonB-linked outer membrane protein, partial [Bacteroidetes bacterium]|nr:SusC/RagA family TonB-linked outer membrane protein [Bacteroidota bacterium]